MQFNVVHISETDSTNRWLKDSRGRHEVPLCVVTEYQTAGRGCGSNTWESERGENLLFSLLFNPKSVKASGQFQLSKAIAVAIGWVLAARVGLDNVYIKWPNDVYVGNRKICGILIECQIKGEWVNECIIGVGLNVNQQEFHSDAPNPVSIRQLKECDTDREWLLNAILDAFDPEADVDFLFNTHLYRSFGMWPFRDRNGRFMACIDHVESDGHLVVRDESGQQRRYGFKEIEFINK